MHSPTAVNFEHTCRKQDIVTTLIDDIMLWVLIFNSRSFISTSPPDYLLPFLFFFLGVQKNCVLIWLRAEGNKSHNLAKNPPTALACLRSGEKPHQTKVASLLWINETAQTQKEGFDDFSP